MQSWSDVRTGLKPSLALALASVGVLAASIGFGLTPFFAKSLTDNGLAAHAVAFYRFLLAALLLWPLLTPHARAWRAMLWGCLSGALMGVGWTGYVLALDVVPVSTVAVIYMAYPVFTLLLAWAIASERPTARAATASVIIVGAAALASAPAAVDPSQLAYVLLALTAPFGFGFSIVVLVHKLTAIPPAGRIATASVGAVIGLAPLMALSPPETVVPSAAEDWALIVGIALTTALAPQLLYAVCAPIVGAGRAATLGSVELPTMFLVGLLAFGQAIGPLQALACALVLTAILIANTGGRRISPAR